MSSQNFQIEANQSSNKGLVGWWYRWTAPSAPLAKAANFRVRDRVRRGKTASWILAVIIILALLPIVGVLNKPAIVGTLLFAFALNCTALLLNRAGRLEAAALLVIFTVEAGLVGTLFTIVGGMGSVDLPLFDLLVQAEIVAAVMLVPWSAFLVMLLNIGVVFIALHGAKLSPELASLLATRGTTIFIQAVEVQFIVAVLVYVITRTANTALKEQDRAEEIADLERREIEQQEEQLKLKAQLELGIEAMQRTHTEVSNGNFAARVPLNRDNLLWPLAYSLNNLLQRLQKNAEGQRRLERTEQAVRMLAQYVRMMKDPSQNAPAPPRTGTAVDEVVMELLTRPGAVPQRRPPLNP